jgi:rhodanese-related sulfurtransferase
MKFGIQLLFAGLLMASCSEAQHSGENDVNTPPASDKAQKAIISKVLNPEEFQALIGKEDYQLLDVRTQQEYAGGHIENATNMNFFDADFKSQLEKLDKTKPVLIYCASGNRSGKATVVMLDMGFTEIYDLRGGYGNWPY